jgi:hypothetical protein
MIKFVDKILFGLLIGFSIGVTIAIPYIVITKYLASRYIPLIILAAGAGWVAYAWTMFPLIKEFYMEIKE